MAYAVSLESCELLSPTAAVEGSGIVTVEVRSEWSNGSGGLNTASYEVLVNGEDITPHTGDYSVGLGPFEDVTDEASNATYIGDGEMDFIQDGENTVEILYDEERYHCGTFTANLSSDSGGSNDGGGSDGGGDSGGGWPGDGSDSGGSGQTGDPSEDLELANVNISKKVNGLTVTTQWNNTGGSNIAFREVVDIGSETKRNTLYVYPNQNNGSSIEATLEIPEGESKDVEVCVESESVQYVS